MHDHIYRLLARRQRLDTTLAAEMARPAPDPVRLLRLRHVILSTRRAVNRLLGAELLGPVRA